MSQPNPIHGWEVQAMRHKLGLSQSRLGALLKMHRIQIIGIEHGKFSTPKRCASVLRTMIDTADYLIARRKTPNWDI